MAYHTPNPYSEDCVQIILIAMYIATARYQQIQVYAQDISEMFHAVINVLLSCSLPEFLSPFIAHIGASWR